MTRNQILQDTAKFFLENKRPVHITLLSGTWLNGIVIFADDTRLVLKEERFGEMLVFYERIKDDGIEPREVKV